MIITVGLYPEHAISSNYIVSSQKIFLCCFFHKTRTKLSQKLVTKDRKGSWGFMAEFSLKVIKEKFLFYSVRVSGVIHEAGAQMMSQLMFSIIFFHRPNPFTPFLNKTLALHHTILQKKSRLYATETMSHCQQEAQ